MQKNKFTTYLLYAIGEIILVVIGILIAISLNNWNNERISLIENEKLLNNLIIDLESDAVKFYGVPDGDGSGVSMRTGIDNCAKAKKMSYLKLDDRLADSLLSLTINAGLEVLNAETNVYDQLKSTGRLYSIGSDTLRRKIIDYYSKVSSQGSYIDRYNELMMGYLVKLDFYEQQ